MVIVLLIIYISVQLMNLKVGTLDKHKQPIASLPVLGNEDFTLCFGSGVGDVIACHTAGCHHALVDSFVNKLQKLTQNHNS